MISITLAPILTRFFLLNCVVSPLNAGFFIGKVGDVMTLDKDALDICNRALALIGHNCALKSLEEPYESVEARSCARWFPACFSESLARYSWTFARRDEVITDDYLTDLISLPWKYTYKLPKDVEHIFSLASRHASSMIESSGTQRGYKRFSIRNIDNVRYLVTDVEPGFVINYQANDVSISICPPLFISAVVYQLAGRLAAEFVKSEIGISEGVKFLELYTQELYAASVDDANQGSYSLKNDSIPQSIRARL